MEESPNPKLFRISYRTRYVDVSLMSRWIPKNAEGILTSRLPLASFRSRSSLFFGIGVNPTHLAQLLFLQFLGEFQELPLSFPSNRPGALRPSSFECAVEIRPRAGDSPSIYGEYWIPEIISLADFNSLNNIYGAESAFCFIFVEDIPNRLTVALEEHKDVLISLYLLRKIPIFFILVAFACDHTPIYLDELRSETIMLQNRKKLDEDMFSSRKGRTIGI